MNMPLWFYNLAVYCVQLAILITAGGLTMSITRIRDPRFRLIYWQILLVLGLLLPVIEPWRAAPRIREGLVSAVNPIAHAGNVGIGSVHAMPVHAGSGLSIYELIAFVLVAGLLFRLLWLVAGLIRLRRTRLHAGPLGFSFAVEKFKKILGVSPTVLVSDEISSPVTFGWHRPHVLLPAKCAQMDELRQHSIICHEFLHVRRKDWPWHVGEEILRALFWFHVAVLWLIAQIRLSREQVVDRRVVTLAGSRRDYLDALYEIASASSASHPAPALLFLSERRLKRRVSLILQEVEMSRKKLILAFSACLGVLIFAVPLIAAWLPLQNSPSVQRLVKPSEDSTEAQWVNGPVSCIILPRARAAFERLTTSAEREMFIREFWEQRNPNPGSATNNFKKQFYRRVAFVNEHFAGWQTDRGRFYIMYGPPDQIRQRKYPRGLHMPYSYQIWIYRHLPGIGDNLSMTFIDRTGKGDYQLAPGKAR